MTTKTLEIIAIGKDQASPALQGVGSSVSGLGSVAAGVATGGLALAAAAVVALGTAAVGATVGVVKLTMAATEFEGTRKVFNRLEGDMGSLKTATRNMVSETDLMAASNKLMTMGIANTTGEVAEMAEMATQLGLAMEEDATKSMENWTLMMANQSIPRLDSFGISSSVVRARIEELTKATEGLSREEAFKIAVLEQGRVAMEKVGEQGDSATATTLRWKAVIADLGYGIGRAFVPALEAIRKPALDLVEQYGPKVVAWAEIGGQWLGENLPKGIEKLEKAWTSIQPGLIWARDTFQAFSEKYLPHLSGAWDILRKGWDEISALYNRELKPALAELWETLGLGKVKSDDIAGGFGSFMGILTKILALGIIQEIKWGIQGLVWALETARHWVITVRDAVESAVGVFNRIMDAVNRVKDAFQRFKDSVANFQLPSWLTPGSPTPLETGLWGIGRALAEVQGLAGRGIGFGGAGTVNNASTTTNNYLTMNVMTQATSSTVQMGFETMRALYV